MNYAPGVSDNRGALYLTGLLQSGRNMSEALTAAGGWLNNFLEQQKQINAAGKSADYFVKADPSALSQIGVHPDEWANMGARDKASAVQGLMQSRAGQQAAAENQARTALQLSQANRLGQTTQLTAEESQALPVLMQHLDELNQANPGRPGTPGLPSMSVPLPPGLRMLPGEGAGQAPPGLGGEMPPLPGGIAVPGVAGTPGTAPMMTPQMAAMVHAAAQMGATNPKLAAAIARQILPSLLQSGGGTPSSISSQNLPGGYLGFTLPGSREMQIRPPLDALVSAMRNGTIPATSVTGPNGEVVADVIPNQRGGVQVVGKPPAEKQLPEHFFSQYLGPAGMPRTGLAPKLDQAQQAAVASDEDIKNDPAYFGMKPADVRAKEQAKIPVLQKKLQDLFALYQKQGYGNADVWDQLYSQHGLQNQAGATANAQAGAKAAPAPKAKEAQGGYKLGNVYGGLRYLGGDPKDQANWQNR